MPELPEVETIRRGLEQYVVGHTIEDIEVRLAKIVQGDTKDILGAKVVGARRFGKGLVIDLDNDFCLAIHIKLTGQLVYMDEKNHPPQKIKVIKGTHSTLPNKWTHVVFTLKGKSVKGKGERNAYLYYNDFRQFGWIKIVQSAKLKDQSFFKDLGPEFPVVYSSSEVRSSKHRDSSLRQSADRTILTLEKFADILKKSKTVIKPLLLDQKKMSGVGNIYANDGLFDARIDPRRKASSLTDAEIERLFHSLEKVLKKGLETGGASELSFINVLGQEGHYQDHFLVYAQEGKPCKRKNGTIEKIMVGGRGTYFCPQCQK